MEPIKNSWPAFSILVVDDDKVARETMCRLIATNFREVTIYTAENGKLGLDLFKEHKPDIVITDINMPEMDGVQMAREAKSFRYNARFIVLTGNSDEELCDEFSKIGVIDYLMKPIGINQLFAAIVKCISEIMHARRGSTVW